MGIKKRTVFIDLQSGRFFDLALVTTTIGAMAEPFEVNQLHTPGRQTIDIKIDEMNQIDEIQYADSDKLSAIFGDQTYGNILHRCDLMPRSGR